MNLDPLVSVIVPNYNHSEFLVLRLDSIFNQIFQDFEVILLDDASTDNSLDILERYASHPKVSHLIKNKKNSGSTFKQWQKGISLANGAYIWIAESDDYCELTFLENIIRYLKKSKEELGIVYAQSLDIDAQGNSLLHRIDYTLEFNPNIWSHNFMISGKDFIKNYLKVKNVIPNASAVVFKRSLLDNETFSEELLNMKMCGDWLFWLKLSDKSRVGFIAEPLNFFRNHSDVSRNHYNHSKIIVRLLEETLIRRFLSVHFNIDQKKEIGILYKNWFKIHSFKTLMKKSFYNIQIKKESHLAFLLNSFISR